MTRRSPTDQLSQTLQRSCGRHHSRSHLYAAKDGVLHRNNEIASEGKLEAAAKRDVLDGRNGRYLQSFDSAILLIDFRDKGAEPIHVLMGPLPQVGAEAEVGSFRVDHQNTNVAFARVTHRVPKTFRKLAIDEVAGRIGEDDASNCALAFEANGFHSL